MMNIHSTTTWKRYNKSLLIIAFLSILLPCMLFTVSARSQTVDYSKYIKTIDVDGKQLTVLRLGYDIPDSRINGFVVEIESMLKSLKYDYKTTMARAEDSHLGVEYFCKEIEKVNSTFPVHYYRDELQAFSELHNAIKQQEQKKWDDRIAQQKEIERQERETQRIRALKFGHFWINRDSINVRSKPNTQSPIIGQIHRLSSVKAYDVDNKPDWSEIEFDDYTGYVLGKYLANDWEELNPDSDDSTKLLSGYYNFVANETVVAQVKRANAAKEARSLGAGSSTPGRKYHVGPKGGCYFINSHGNKEYVDRSYCH